MTLDVFAVFQGAGVYAGKICCCTQFKYDFLANISGLRDIWVSTEKNSPQPLFMVKEWVWQADNYTRTHDQGKAVGFSCFPVHIWVSENNFYIWTHKQEAMWIL